MTTISRDSDNLIFLNGDVCSMELKLSLLGWDFEMEIWKDRCCSRREALAIRIEKAVRAEDV